MGESYTFGNFFITHTEYCDITTTSFPRNKSIINGEAFLKPIDLTATKKTPVFQLEQRDDTNGKNQTFFNQGDGTRFGDGYTYAWEVNNNGIPRLQIVFEGDSVRFFATNRRDDTVLSEVFIPDDFKQYLQLPTLKVGENSLSMFIPDGLNADELKGNVQILKGSGFKISDKDGTSVSKAIIKLIGNYEGVFITPTLPKGITASLSNDKKTITLEAKNFVKHRDFEDAISLLMFGPDVKANGQLLSNGQKEIEITIYDEDGLASQILKGSLDYQSSLGNVYISQFEFMNQNDSYDNDTIYGAEGNDTIDAGLGDDVIYGLSGNDILIGGAGNDVLYGGEGADIFKWQAGDYGNDQIMDFTVGEDKIDIQELLVDLGWDSSNINLSDFIKVNENEKNTTLEIKQIGADLKSVIVLEGVKQLGPLEDLITNQIIIV